MKQAVYEFVTVGAQGRGGGSPLHLACARDSSSVGRYPICVFPSVAAIDLLLECGADPNGKDNVSGAYCLPIIMLIPLFRMATPPFTRQL